MSEFEFNFLVNEGTRLSFKVLTLFVGIERSRLKIAAMSCLLGSDIILHVVKNDV